MNSNTPNSNLSLDSDLDLGTTTAPSRPPGTNPKPRRFRLPPELQDLTGEQLEYLNDSLEAHTYAQVQEMLLVERGIRISINKLFRYYQKVQLAQQLELADDTTDAVEQLLHLYNGQALDLDTAGLETVKRRALSLAASPSTKPSLLLQLMRVFTWEHRKSMEDHRKQMDFEKSAHRDRMARIAERRAICDERRVKILESSGPSIHPSPSSEKPCISEIKPKILTPFATGCLENPENGNQPWGPAALASPAPLQ